MPLNNNNPKIEDIFDDLAVSAETPAVNLEKPKVDKAELPKERPPALIIQEVQEKPPVLQETNHATSEKLPAASSASKTAVSPAAYAIYLKVEKVLEEDLAEVYFKLPKNKQAEFKKSGEVTAIKISQLLQAVKIKVRQIFQLIIGWLSIIPGVNKHFLEQEAKIKTDRLLALREKELKK